MGFPGSSRFAVSAVPQRETTGGHDPGSLMKAAWQMADGGGARILCHMSYVICHMSCVMCHLPSAICHLPCLPNDTGRERLPGKRPGLSFHEQPMLLPQLKQR